MGPEDLHKLSPIGDYVIYDGPVSAPLTSLARSLLSGELGTRTEFRYQDGRMGMARVEPHPPAPERGLTEWHKGVTLYVSTVQEPSSTYLKSSLVVFLLLGIGYIYSRRETINETLHHSATHLANRLHITS